MSEGTKWLEWVQELLSISQAGLTYSQNPYDLERFARLKEIAAEIGAHGSDGNFEKIKELFAKETGYQTPKVDVRGAVIQDGKIVLVREKNDEGKWTLPGGWADIGSLPSENAEREVFEECGLHVKAERLVAVLDRSKQVARQSPWSIYKLFFICKVLGGELRPSFETPEVRWFAEDELPQEGEMSLGRTRRYQLLRMFEYYKNPELPADFD